MSRYRKYPDGVDRCAYLPSEEEIQLAKEKIQSSWTPAVREGRRTLPGIVRAETAIVALPSNIRIPPSLQIK